MCKCPCHHDKKASLSIDKIGDRILLHCFAGCKSEDILAAVGLTFSDLSPNTKMMAVIKADGYGHGAVQIADMLESVDYIWGYFSNKDGTRHQFDLCEDCYDRFVKELSIPITESENNELL